MKQFAYRLERLLNLRKYREREWEHKLADATRICINLQREIDDRYSGKSQVLHSRFQSGMSPTELFAYHLYTARLDQEISSRQFSLMQGEKERLKVQEGYIEASKNRKVLENLKDRQALAYNKIKKLEEVRELDDINTGRVGRNERSR